MSVRDLVGDWLEDAWLEPGAWGADFPAVTISARMLSSLSAGRSFVKAAGACLLALALGCSPATEAEEAYPEHWWTPVPESEKAWWEILPQAAGPGEVILSKRNELGLLSNFAATPFDFRGKRYASLEGLWYSMYYPEGPDDPRASHPEVTWRHTRPELERMVGFEAKEAGELAEANMAVMGIDWITFEGERIEHKGAGQARHYEIIEAATRAKVRQNPEVREVLMATGDLVLKPDHTTGEDDPPAWRYYKIYMKLRAELKIDPKALDVD